MFITLKHSVDDLEISIFDDTTSAEAHLCFNKENMKFWHILFYKNILSVVKRSVFYSLLH